MILYIQTAFLGDLLLSIPTLKYLRQLYPNKDIHLLCRRGLGSFFTQLGLVDRAYEGFKTSKPSWKEIGFFFKRNKYDVVICPHESVRSHLIVTRVRADKKIGYKKPWNFLVFDERHERPMYLPEALRQLVLLKNLDPELKRKIDTLSEEAPFKNIPSWASMELEYFEDREKFKNQLREKQGVTQDKVYVLSPGSVWPTKRWGINKYKSLAEKLLQSGHDVILVGAPDEKSTALEIVNSLPKVINLTGKTNLLELAEVIAGSDGLVANDSGAMHMASVAGTSCVAMFGPTVQSFGYQPWNPKAQVLENKVLNCRPCSSHGTKECPIGTHECMTSIEVQAVLRELK